MTTNAQIAIVGAGPYGLSLAAHLAERGLRFRIIGKAMDTWIRKMPEGMHLKSTGFASNLYDPSRSFTLRRYCKERNIPYDDLEIPVKLETFADYGVAFQKQLVPNLEDEVLVSLEMCNPGFELHLASGASFRADQVVLAVGYDYFRNIPEPLLALPKQLYSHSAEIREPRSFSGKRLAVIGGGASAIETAVLLLEAGAQVQLIVRKPSIHFGNPWGGSSWTYMDRVRWPLSRIGPGWKNRLLANHPWLFRYFPEHTRIRVARTFLGPSAGWSVKQRAAHLPLLAGRKLIAAGKVDSQAHLRLAGPDGGESVLSVDHVIAATGYRPDVRELPFLQADIKKTLRLTGSCPKLSAHFESSVPGLYFAGILASTSFGPVMRFAAGAEFASRRVASRLAALGGPEDRSTNLNRQALTASSNAMGGTPEQ